MRKTELIALIDRLRKKPSETEWLEFKVNRHSPQALGKYLSALSNAACLTGESRGYLLFGVHNDTHEVVGTSFDPYVTKGKGNQDLLLWLGNGLQPNVGFEVFIVDHSEGRVVLFEIKPAFDRPVKFYGTAYIRIGTSLTELVKHPEKEKAIWMRRVDWSAEICQAASLADLDSQAILKAREQFKVKHQKQATRVDEWDDATFLNKAKLTVRGAITHAAILLLGKSESAPLLSPAVAKITWILKDEQNQELDYQHFGPPFIMQVDRVLDCIRKLTLRTMPSGTLFPQEITQYDPWVIREALHNCIAHQDYGLQGRINVVESPHSIMLTNVGTFLPGNVERVIQQDAPLEIYRNPHLAEAMVNLNMIDTQGGGIKRMFQEQIRRFFPLPDYNLSEANRVAVTIRGEILDEQYTRLLMERSDLPMWDIILLDKVQKRIKISREDHKRLKAAKLVEGRYPNLIIAGKVASIAGQKARHIKDRGLDKKYYLDMICELIREHGPVDRKDVDAVLMRKLPEVLTDKQKKVKIHNLLAELARSHRIKNNGSRARPRWEIDEVDSRLTKQTPGLSKAKQ